jgi:uncharacterized protein (DUF433 family)
MIPYEKAGRLLWTEKGRGYTPVVVVRGLRLRASTVDKAQEAVEMERARWQQKVVADPAVHHGEPCIRGTRIPVRMIVGSLADGMTVEQVIGEYPQLAPEDVFSALAYAAEVLHEESLVPLLIEGGPGANQGR